MKTFKQFLLESEDLDDLYKLLWLKHNLDVDDADATELIKKDSEVK